MEGDVETIRALVKGETGKGCKTAEGLLSVGDDDVTLVLFVVGDTLVLFVGTVDSGEREEGFVLLLLVRCVGEAETVVLILGDELEE